MEDRMIEEGIVIEVFDGMAKVRAVRGSSCDGCASRTMCKPLEGSDVVIEAKNHLGACVGARVEVAMQPRTFLKASFIAYMVPLISFFIGGAAGKWIGGTDMWAALSGMFFMFFCYIGIYIYNKRSLKGGKYRPEIIAVLSP